MAYLTYITAILGTILFVPLAVCLSGYWLCKRRWRRMLHCLGLAALVTGLLALATYAGLEIDYGEHRGLMKLGVEALFYVGTLGCITLAIIGYQSLKPTLIHLLQQCFRQIKSLSR